MADTFNIFGSGRQALKNVARQPLSNIENMGKTVSAGPVKLNEPLKKLGDAKPNDKKKSFMSNTGKALQSTPVRQAFTPIALKVGSLIYTDDNKDEPGYKFEEFEFTKPKTYDYELDFLDRFIQPEILQDTPTTPPPTGRRHSMESFNTSYTDEFFTDDFTCNHVPETDFSFDNILYNSNDSILDSSFN